MFKKALIASLAAFALVAALTGASGAGAQAPTPDAVTGWGWSSNTGWIAFSSSDVGSGSASFGVFKDPSTGKLSGYAWTNNEDSATGQREIRVDQSSQTVTQTQDWIAYTYPGYGDYYIYLSKLPATSYTVNGKTILVYDPVKIWKGGKAAFLANPQSAINSATDVPVGYTRTPDTRYLFNVAQLRAEPVATANTVIDNLGSYIENRFLCMQDAVNASQCHVNNLGVWSVNTGRVAGGPIYVSASDSDGSVSYTQAEIIGTYGVSGGTQTVVNEGTVVPNVSTSNVGWITFNENELSGCPTGDCSARITDGRLLGWARACTVFASGCSGPLKPDSERGGWQGWISLAGTAQDGSSYGPVVNPAEGGLLEGFAWGSDIFGWIKFDLATAGVIVTQSYQCSDSADNDGDNTVDSADTGCHSDGNAGNAASYVPTDDSEDDSDNRCPRVTDDVSLPSATIGFSYAHQVGVGGDEVVSLTATGLPPGLTLNGRTISGTPTTGGTYSVRMTADNDVPECSVGAWSGTLTVNAPGNEILGLSCSASRPARLNLPVTWTASTLLCPGTCTYTWSGDGTPAAPAPAPTGSSFTATYSTSGQKVVDVTARSSNGPVSSATCRVNVGDSYIIEER